MTQDVHCSRHWQYPMKTSYHTHGNKLKDRLQFDQSSTHFSLDSYNTEPHDFDFFFFFFNCTLLNIYIYSLLYSNRDLLESLIGGPTILNITFKYCTLY